jgi:hypothetical protein
MSDKTTSGPASPVASGTPEPVATVVQYSVSCLPRRNPNYRHYVVSVIEREIGRWVVRAGGEVRDANGNPIQPVPEGDDVAAWAAGHRFDLDTALNGYTVADALRMGGDR